MRAICRQRQPGRLPGAADEAHHLAVGELEPVGRVEPKQARRDRQDLGLEPARRQQDHPAAGGAAARAAAAHAVGGDVGVAELDARCRRAARPAPRPRTAPAWSRSPGRSPSARTRP